MTIFQHRVRYHEVDKQGFLFNSRYFEIADVAMTEYFRELGWNYDGLIAEGMDPSVVNIEADFTGPAKFDDVLDIEISCARVGNTSFTLQNLISRHDLLLAKLQITYVNVDLGEVKSALIPPNIASKLSVVTN